MANHFRSNTGQDSLEQQAEGTTPVEGAEVAPEQEVTGELGAAAAAASHVEIPASVEVDAMGVAFDQEGAPVAAVATQVDSIPAPVEAEPAAQVAAALDAVVPSLDAEPLMTATPQVAQAAQVPVSAVPGVNPGAVQAEQVFAQAPSVVVQTAGFSAEAGATQEDPTAQAGYTSVFAPLAPQANEDTSHINRNGTPVISLKHVTKIYPAQPNKPALEDVSLDIYPGEFVFLVGHSGSGKSTFLKLLTRELRATSGEVNVAGQNLTNMRNWKVPYLRRQIGCVFQDFKLLPDKTTYENVAFTLECIGKPRSVVRAQVPEVLRLVGLGEKMDMYPDQLSGGEQQRVSVARAMVNRPPLLICDEPTGNLDPAISLGIMKLLERINRTGTTVLMATHDREMVDSMRKRVIALEAGHLVRDQERGGYGYYGAL